MAQTAKLRNEPDYLTPGGSTEIRELVNTPDGEISHAVVHQGQVAHTAWNDGLIETLDTQAGHGELWIHDGKNESTTDMRPGRATLIPTGARYQYRARPNGDMTIFVAVVPKFVASRHHPALGGPWTATSSEASPNAAPARAEGLVQTRDLPWWLTTPRQPVLRSDSCPSQGTEGCRTAPCLPGPRRRRFAIAPWRSCGRP